MKILVIDIETTGFINSGGKIVKVGIVSLDLTNGDREIVFSSLVHEIGITLEEVQKSWIVQNGYITMEEIRYSPNLSTKLAEIQAIISAHEHGATAFNRSFDFDFLESRGIKFPKKLPCPMLLSTPICKCPNANDRAVYKWPKVMEAYKFFFPESNYDELHRGADDAIHEAEIVYELHKRGLIINQQ
jgi:DNA polymerase III epsilon subunit-like protein